MTERRNLCGLQFNFASIPTLLKKMFCSSAYIIRERWASRGLGKSGKKIENLKHCDDLNRALRVGGQKQYANETQHGFNTKQKKTCNYNLSIILWLAEP
jgi:hypothetical protein